ncbi:CHAT domain-containing protein [Mycena filopes]|nr:CHAT domain-containing protein [Mycena filopes]
MANLPTVSETDGPFTRLQAQMNNLPPDDPQRCRMLDALARIRLRAYADDRDPALLTDAIEDYRAALNLQPTDRGPYLYNLGSCYLMRFNSSSEEGRERDLYEAGQCYRDGIDIISPTHSARASSFRNAASVFALCFECFGRELDLNDAIRCLRELIQLQPDDLETQLCKLGDSLLRRFYLFQRIVDLEEAIVSYKRALEFLPAGESARTTCLNNLARALLHSFQINQSPSVITDAVEFCTQAVASQPLSHPDRASSLDELGSAFRLRFQVSRQTVDLEAALRNQKEALKLTPLGDPDRPVRLSNLALCLFRKYQDSDQLTDLEQSITYYREALQSQFANSDPNRPTSLNDLATALSSRFEVLRALPDLDESVALCREAVLLCPPTHRNRLLYEENLAKTLRARYQLQGNLDDLHATIKQQRSLVLLLSAADCPPALTQLGDDLYLRYASSNELEDLNGAIASYTEANSFAGHNTPTLDLARADTADLDQLVELSGPSKSESDKHRAVRLQALAMALFRRSQLQSGGDDDLDRAIKCQKASLHLEPSGLPNRATSLLALSEMRLLRFENSHNSADIDEAILLRRESLDICLPDERTSFLVAFAASLRRRFQLRNEGADIDEAVSCAREAAASNPKHRAELAISLFEQFRFTGELKSLDESVSHFRGALAHDHDAADSDEQGLHSLVVALYARFRHSGNMAYLEEALVYAQTALDLRPASSVALGDLADCLLGRYDHWGQVADLETSIELYKRAHVVEPQHQDISRRMNMAYALVSSFRMSRREEELEEGLAHYRTTLPLCGHDDTARQLCLSNLANALRVAFEYSKRLADVDEAAACYRQALDLCAPQAHAARSLYRLNFGTALLSRFIITRDEADLDEALVHLEDAAATLPPNVPLHALSQFNLGTALWYKYEVARPADADRYARVLTLLQNATRLPFSSVKSRFEAALQWSGASRSKQHPSTIQAYSCSLRLLEKWMIVNPEVEAQHRFLAADQSRYTIACDGASAAIDFGDLESAVELLEHGRTVLWSRLQGYRQSMDELQLQDSELADRFKSLSQELEGLSLGSEAKTSTLWAGKDTMATQRVLSEKWDEVVAQIRQTDGFAHFLEPTPYTALSHAASGGPVILINVSRFRSDAIILMPDRPPTLAPLPNVSLLALAALSSQVSAASTSRGPGATRQLVSVLRALWTDVVQPITQQLDALGVERHSRIWWCPTSYLCGLPLHAAGSYRKDDPRPALPDLFVSSYTPTLSALIRARNANPIAAAPKILVVGRSERGLPAVEEEIHALERLGPFVRTLTGENTTQQNVRTMIEEYPWVHFACHANQARLPFESSFELHDGQITLLDLIRSRRPNAQLAFLSACNTATGDAETPDETLHLAAALQFSGFQSVVGTLWQMADEDGPRVAREFYRHLFRLGQDQASARDSAVALSMATKCLRKTGVPLDRWINFVHIGA